MTTGKIKFPSETPSTLLSIHAAPAPGSTRNGPSTVPAQSLRARTGGTVQAITDRRSLGLPPLKMVLVHTENERRNNASKTVIRWREAQEEIDIEKIVQRIIDHLNKKP